MEFNELNLAEMDKDLTAEERAEWQAIYASYRSGSGMRGEAAARPYGRFRGLRTPAARILWRSW